MALGDTFLTITLDKPLYGGYAIGRHKGKAILVPYGIPGEMVSVAITEDKKDYAFASIVSIIEQSDSRIIPQCPHFTVCGGCSYLHMPYDEELSCKKSIVEDNLGRIAGLPAHLIPAIETVHDDRHNYRSHAALKAEKGLPGFYRKGTNDFVSIRKTGCLLLSRELNDWILNDNVLPDDARIAADTDSRIITSFGKNPVVAERVGSLSFLRDIDRFFQANRCLRERMLDIVIGYAGINDDEVFMDFDCGVGFFTLPLAEAAGSGTGIDISEENIRWARHNARVNCLDNIRFQAMASSRVHPGRHHPDLVVIDPPRAGIDKKSRRTIMAMDPPRIVYVSCNPATFSRDARDFVSGGYIIDRLTLIDMFPCTHHIELISLFVKK
ncbi:MAG: class I SAM-dependent RNA methyltransferase [Spirochaetes bacterium]|nr:class I SAM-dependent RNA methyltransferase [Spirochaetota bacterium]